MSDITKRPTPRDPDRHAEVSAPVPEVDHDSELRYLKLRELDFFNHHERLFLINCVFAGASQRALKMIIAAKTWPTLDEEQLQTRLIHIEGGCRLRKPRGDGQGTVVDRTHLHYDVAINALLRTKVAEQADFARESGDARRAAMHEMLAMSLDRTLEHKDRISAAKAVAALAGKDAVDVAAIAANAGRAELAERLERAAKAGAQAVEQVQ